MGVCGTFRGLGVWMFGIMSVKRKSESARWNRKPHMLCVAPMSVALPTAGGSRFRAAGTTADVQERVPLVDVQTSKHPNVSSVPLRPCASVLKIGPGGMVRASDERAAASLGPSGVGSPVGCRGRRVGGRGGDSRAFAVELAGVPAPAPGARRAGRRGRRRLRGNEAGGDRRVVHESTRINTNGRGGRRSRGRRRMEGRSR